MFDSSYDAYRGIIVYLRVMEGTLRAGQEVKLMGSEHRFELTELGVFRPKMTPVAQLATGETGYLIAGIKDVGEARSGEHGPTGDPAAHPTGQADRHGT